MSGRAVAHLDSNAADRAGEVSEVTAIPQVTAEGAPGQSHSRLVAVGRERRGAERATYLSPVRVMRGDKPVDGTIQNVSINGVLVTVPRGTLKVGEFAVVRFMLPISGAIISVQGIAVRVLSSRRDADDVAMHLSLVPEQAQAEIARFVTALAPPADDPFFAET